MGTEVLRLVIWLESLVRYENRQAVNGRDRRHTSVISHYQFYGQLFGKYWGYCARLSLFSKTLLVSAGVCSKDHLEQFDVIPRI